MLESFPSIIPFSRHSLFESFMINIGDWIQKWSFLQPHKRALIYEDRQFTCQEMIEELVKTASGKDQKFYLKEWHQTGSTKLQAPNSK